VASVRTTDTREELAAEALQFLGDANRRLEGAPFLHRVRAVAPVLRTDAGVWLVTRHADGLAIQRDGRRWSRHAFTEQYVGIADPKVLKYHLSGRPSMSDGSDHRRLRALASPAFTPVAMKRWRTQIEEIATRLLDELEPKGAMDATSELGYPFSQQVISFLLGVPYEDHVMWESCAERMIPLLLGIDTEEGKRQATEATFEWAEYVGRLAAKERETPSGGLFSELVNAADDGSHLSDAELVGFAHEIVTAGFETVANTIAMAMLLLLRHPDQLAQLRHNPSLWPGAIEEVLRYVPPGTMTMPRMALDDVHVGAVTVPRGETAIVFLDGVNRDPEVFVDPDQFDIAREPNPHLGFGFGSHFCIGAGLARMELNTLLPMVFERLPAIRLVDEQPHWREASGFLRALDKLEVTW
jgi:cytochrome P450